jgi:hypothetical protein
VKVRHPNNKMVWVECRRVRLLGYLVTVCCTLRKGVAPHFNISTYEKVKKKVTK